MQVIHRKQAPPNGVQATRGPVGRGDLEKNRSHKIISTKLLGCKDILYQYKKIVKQKLVTRGAGPFGTTIHRGSWVSDSPPERSLNDKRGGRGKS